MVRRRLEVMARWDGCIMIAWGFIDLGEWGLHSEAFGREYLESLDMNL
jgi:hypothetical protein